MREYRLRQDLERQVSGGYALPLGIDIGTLSAPEQGYTLAYTPGEDDEPDSYSFHVVVSHERVKPILHRAFGLLPDKVTGIVEAGSRDAYRSIDVFLGTTEISLEHFLESWKWYESFLLEDCYIAAGANSEEPHVEVFLDQWKGISMHVPLDMRDEVEAFLNEFGLEEVIETWPSTEDDLAFNSARVIPVLDLVDDFSPDIDEMILELRHEWGLELNVDPDTNSDEGGRELGLTLWHALVIVDKIETMSQNDTHAAGTSDSGAYASIWATAGSLIHMQQLIEDELEQNTEWRFAEIYTIDRVAFDERPEHLTDLTLRRDQALLHSLTIESWQESPKDVTDG
ncbi:MAG: hypothetical protein IID30_07200 [Planctomycetes bacterium]|nr:hypothetical protein [Planctomycetota bacterium]